jgi:F-type H+-transporting ATPase subunit b
MTRAFPHPPFAHRPRTLVEALTLLGIDGSLVLLQTIPFVLALVGLNALIFKPMLAMLAEREKNIHGFRKEADLLQDELASKMAELDERLTEARAQASVERVRLRAETKVAEDVISSRARAEADAILGEARTKLDAATAAARKELQSTAADLSKQISASVLGRSLEN